MTARLYIDTEQYGAVLRAFRTLPGEIDKAEIRALNKTALWVKTQAARETSQAAKIAGKLVRNRLRILRASKRRPFAKVWYGLNPIPARLLGKVRQTKRGVRAGRHDFPGAFVTGFKSGRTGVFERATPARRWTAGRSHQSTPNLPLKEAELILDSAEVQRAIHRTYARAGERFVTLLRQELNYIVNVAKRR